MDDTRRHDSVVVWILAYALLRCLVGFHVRHRATQRARPDAVADDAGSAAARESGIRLDGRGGTLRAVGRTVHRTTPACGGDGRLRPFGLGLGAWMPRP